MKPETRNQKRETVSVLIDTHAHLTDEQLSGEVDQIVARAGASGVAAIIDVGDSLDSSRRCIEHAGRYDVVWASIGIHPNNVASAGKKDIDELALLVSHKRVAAIGETGLDYYRDKADPLTQEHFFKASLGIASDSGLPVIIHCRQAYDALIRILRGAKGITGVIHCFSGTVMQAEALFEMGHYISIGGPITYPGNANLRKMVSGFPADRILIETDCPYLSPQCVRGERNEPAYLKDIAEDVARVRGIAAEELGRITTANAFRLFDRIQGVKLHDRVENKRE